MISFRHSAQPTPMCPMVTGHWPIPDASRSSAASAARRFSSAGQSSPPIAYAFRGFYPRRGAVGRRRGSRPPTPASVGPASVLLPRAETAADHHAGDPGIRRSPEQIAGWLKRAHRGEESHHVSHETIYRSLFVPARGVLKKELLQHLRSKRTIRRSKQARRKGDGRGQITDTYGRHINYTDRSSFSPETNEVMPCIVEVK